MAANTNKLKRAHIKYIRDGVKTHYPERVECAVCGTKEDLELHHYNSVSLLFWAWQKRKGYPVDTVDQIMDIRDEFYDTYWDELVKLVVTLCAKHHSQLHQIYGPIPALNTARKQERWVHIQRRKTGLDPTDLLEKEQNEDTGGEDVVEKHAVDDIYNPFSSLTTSDEEIADICRLWS